MIKNKIRYLLFCVIAGLLAILYDKYIMGMIFIIVVILPIFLFGVLFITYLKLNAELVTTIHVAGKGEKISVSVWINNPTIFPASELSIRLSCRNAFTQKEHKKKFEVSIDGKTKMAVLCDISSRYAGNMEVSLTDIQIYDYFKIFSLKKKFTDKVKIAVLPNLHEISENVLSSHSNRMIDSDYYSTVKGGDDPSEVFEIRDYREGDRLQKIHWKLSIKQDKLMIKEHSEPMNCAVLVFINLCNVNNEGKLPYLDALLESALSLSYSLMIRGQIHYFSWYDELQGESKRVRIVKRKDLFEVMDELLQARLNIEGANALLSYRADHPNEQYTDFFFITSEILEEQLDSFTAMGAGSTKIIYVNDVIENPISDGMKNHLSEMEMKLMYVKVGHLQEDIEQLNPLESIGN